MALDVRTGGFVRAPELNVTPEGDRWAVRHGNGYLGLVSSEAEAWAIVRAISIEWVPEPRSFAPEGRQTELQRMDA